MRLSLHARITRAALLASLLAALGLAAATPGALAVDLTNTAVDTPVQSPVWGQSLTFTATVTDTTNTAKQPTGAVQFSIDGDAKGGAVPLKGGAATFSTSLELRTHTVSAAFTSDDPLFDNSGGSVTRTVGQASVNIVETATPNPAVAGQDTTFVASVTAAPPSTGAPTGKLAFANPDGSTIRSPQDLQDGRAGFSGWAEAGQYRIFAVYLGDDHFIGRATSVDITVNKADTATSLTASATKVAPGQSVALTALVDVKPPGDIATYGSLQFTAGGTPIGSPIALEGNQGVRVTLTAPSVPGTYTLGVTYTGDDNTNASTAPALAITVGAAGGGASMASQLRAVGSTLMQALRKRGLAALNGTPEPFTAPSAGVLEQHVDSPKALKAAKAVKLATGRRAYSGPGRGVLKLRLTAAGRRAIRQGKTLRVAIVTQFTATGGKPLRVVQRMTVKAKKGARTAALDAGWSLSGVTLTGAKPVHLHGRL